MSAAQQTGAGADLHRDILTTLLPGFVGTSAPAWLLERLSEGLGGVCVFGPNIDSLPQLAELNAELRRANPLAVIAIDEEGGDVTRLFYDAGAPYPGNSVLGRVDEEAETERVGRRVGEALRATGCTLDFAPDADINSSALNPVIGTRSFGVEPELVARHTAAWIRGLQSAGIAASAKHFPGHGDTDTDSHLALPVVDLPLEELRERELLPFRAAIAAGTRTIMTSHILLPQLDAENPATLSPRILHGLLREEMGFEGVIVSDALDMKGASGVHGIPEAAVRALAAGCDLLCIGSNNTGEQMDEILAAIAAAVASGRLPESRVREAAGRVRGLATFAEAGGAADAGSDVPAGRDGLGGIDGIDGLDALDRRDLELARTAFAVGDVAARLDAAERVGTIVRIDTVANIAVGVAPWGPFAAADDEAVAWLDEAALVPLSADDALGDPAAFAGPVLVIGKDLHRHGFAREAIDALRAVRDDVVTVDMGWPDPGLGYADVATYGASRLNGRAVLDFVGEALDRTAVR